MHERRIIIKKLLYLILCIIISVFFSGCNDDNLFLLQESDSTVSIDENGYKTFQQAIDIPKKPEFKNIKLSAKCSKIIKHECQVNVTSESNTNNIIGKVGPAVVLNATDSVSDITIQLTYNEHELRGIPEKNLYPMWVNVKNDEREFIEDFYTDTDNNTISFPAEYNDATYILIDIYKYGGKSKIKDIKQYAYETDITKYNSDWEREEDMGDIIELADKKWAVQNAPVFHVSNVQQLASVVYYVNAVQRKNIEIYLENDIDISGYDWKPMSPYRLDFYGQNHTINGLNINCPDGMDIGFIGYATDINIRDVSFTNAAVTGRKYVGGICGRCQGNKKFTNVLFSGAVYGEAEDTGTFLGSGSHEFYTNCRVHATVNNVPCQYFYYDQIAFLELANESLFTLRINSDNLVEHSGKNNIRVNVLHARWIIYDDDKYYIYPDANKETVLNETIMEELHLQKGKTYHIYIEGFKYDRLESQRGVTRVSNMLQYTYE